MQQYAHSQRMPHRVVKNDAFAQAYFRAALAYLKRGFEHAEVIDDETLEAATRLALALEEEGAL